MSGKGFWLARLPASAAGQARLLHKLQAAQFTHVILKIADGAERYNFDPPAGGLAAAFIPALHEAGIAVWGWQTLYGDQPLFKGGYTADYHLREAACALQQLEAGLPLGLQGYVLEPAGDYERLPQRAAKAAQFMETLRAARPDFPVALTAWKNPAAHPRFPWQAFRQYCHLDLPPVFWGSRPNEAVKQLELSLRQFAALQPELPYSPVAAMLYPRPPTPTELRAFFEKALGLGLPAVSLSGAEAAALLDEPPADRQPDLRLQCETLSDFDWKPPVALAFWDFLTEVELAPLTIPPKPASVPGPVTETVAAPPAAPEPPVELVSPLEPVATQTRETLSSEATLAETEAQLKTLLATAGIELTPTPEITLDSEPSGPPPELPAEGEPLIAPAPVEEPAYEPPVELVSPLEPAAIEEPAYELPIELISPVEPVAIQTRETLSSEATPAETEAQLKALLATVGIELPPTPEITLDSEISGPPPELPAEGEPLIAPALVAEAPAPMLAELTEVEPLVLPAAEPLLPIAFAPESETAPAPVAEEPAPTLAELTEVEPLVVPAAEVETAAPLPPLDRAPEALLPVIFMPESETAPAPEAVPETSLPVETTGAAAETFAVDLAPLVSLAEPPAEIAPAVVTPPVEPGGISAEDTASRFFNALRQGQPEAATRLYAAQFAHVNTDRVEHNRAAVSDFYQTALNQIEGQRLALLSVEGSCNTARARWAARTSTGAVQRGQDIFHLNRAGQIVYHATSLRLTPPVETAQR